MIKLLTVYEQEKLRTVENLKPFRGKNAQLIKWAYLLIIYIFILYFKNLMV